MTRKIVAMPAIPGGIRRGVTIRADLGYAKYAQATWRWWCKQKEIEFVLIEEPLGGPGFAQMPPTFQRWHILDQIIGECGTDIRLAVVDADTMVRWDTPDFIGGTRGFSAVAIRHPDWMSACQPFLSAKQSVGHVEESLESTAPNAARNPGWISGSLSAFQHLFPGVSLNSFGYFNAGIVVLGSDQRRIMEKFLRFSAAHWPQLDAVIKSGDFGTDQTPLNFMLRQKNEPIFFLPGSFNLLHCFPMDAELAQIDAESRTGPGAVRQKSVRKPPRFSIYPLRVCLALHQCGWLADNCDGRDLAPYSPVLPRRRSRGLTPIKRRWRYVAMGSPAGRQHGRSYPFHCAAFRR